MLSGDQYEKDAAVLRKALEGWGTNEEAIIELATKRTNADRQQILKYYKSSFGRDLMSDLDDELGGNVRQTIIALFTPYIDYDCRELNKAMKGMGTNEDALIEIIGTRSNTRIKEIKARYKELFSKELEEHVVEETGGDLKHLLVSLLQCNRSESVNLDKGKLDKDLAGLYEAGEGTWGTDESVFNKIFTLRSPAELRYLNSEYTKSCGKTLTEVVDSEFSGDIRRLLKTVLNANLNPPDYFADKINKACKGMGTNDDVLIRVLVSRDEVDLKDIKVSYKSKFGVTLYDEIKDECSGDYKNLLLGIARD